ncbi:MAG: hypothetical protein M3O33_14980, partial [Cyanobacteriota bacterium]|nr:hypothetical protein [Cyanobacteriota bacterium]
VAHRTAAEPSYFLLEIAIASTVCRLRSRTLVSITLDIERRSQVAGKCLLSRLSKLIQLYTKNLPV